MPELDLITARQAAERLGIKLDTLYAYVSRGRLQSVALRAAESGVIEQRMWNPCWPRVRVKGRPAAPNPRRRCR